MSLVKAPLPSPFDVWLLLVVGFAEVLQQTPLAVTEAPPSDVTLPPLDALFEVMADTVVVVTVGDTGMGSASRTKPFTKTVPSISLPITRVPIRAVADDSAIADWAVNDASHPPSSRTLPDAPMATSSS